MQKEKNKLKQKEKKKLRAKRNKELKERKESTEGDREEFRFRERIVTTPSSKEDQVKKLMLFKAYADPHYLSLAFTNHELLSHNDNLKKDEITELHGPGFNWMSPDRAINENSHKSKYKHNIVSYSDIG